MEILLTESVILFVGVFGLLYGFPPDITPGEKTAYTRHHTEITQNGIAAGIGNYLRHNNLTDLNIDDLRGSEYLQAFFGEDADAFQEHSNKVQEIVDVVKAEERSNLAYVHCNSEEIKLAHNHIIRLRGEIKSLAEIDDPDLNLIRQKIGRCLYTIQAFYSTTNWVELFGIKTYRAFGVPGMTLMSIAGPGDATCVACDNSGLIKDSCSGNLITNKLTSGYQTGQVGQAISYNPEEDTSIVVNGKCGFGGISDTDNGIRVGTVIGGINKDRFNQTYSPHYNEHGYAFINAWTATKEFIGDPEIGIIRELGKNLFEKVFNLKRRLASSFGFTIDVTGSMANDIAEVKKACVEIITNVIGTANEPKDYVLVTFSDPLYLTTHVLTTADGLTMISTIENITVYGGGDCPEYAIDGMLKCVSESRENSTLFFFTDAAAKDEENRSALEDAMNAKSITPEMMLRNPCSARRKRDLTRRTKRQTNGASVYYEIAEATGGSVHPVSTSNLSVVMQNVFEERFPSANAIIAMFTMNTKKATFLVDSMVKNIKIVIIGPTDSDNVSVLSPLGPVTSAENGNILFDNPNKVVISVVNPSPGEYQIKRNISDEWEVKITAQTVVDFDYFILEEKDGYLSRISGNSILDRPYTIFVTVYGLQANISVNMVLLTDIDGITEFYRFTEIASEINSRFYTTTRFQSKFYRFGIMGIDSNGYQWMRTSAFEITSVDIGLSASPVSDLYIGTDGNISYLLTNYGPENETFIVIVNDDRGLVSSPGDITVELATNNSKEIHFGIQGSALFSTITYTVTVQKEGSTTVLQQDKKTLFINHRSPPTCNVIAVEGSCDDRRIDSSCLDAKWTGKAFITFTNEMQEVTISNNLPANVSDLNVSPLQVNVSGTCCTPSAYITVIDVNSNFARCHFYLGEVSYIPDSTATLSEEEKIAIGVVGGIIMASIIVVLALIILLYRGALKPKLDAMKIADINVKATKILPLQEEKTSRTRFHNDFTAMKYDYDNVPPSNTSLQRWN